MNLNLLKTKVKIKMPKILWKRQKTVDKEPKFQDAINPKVVCHLLYKKWNQYADKHRSGASNRLLNLNLLKSMLEMSKNLLERKIVILKMGTKFQDAHESTKMGTNIAVKPRSDASNILKTLILCSNPQKFRWKCRLYWTSQLPM